MAASSLLMAIESACIPLPSEIIMPFSGYLVSTGRFDLALVATAGAIGCNIGSTIAYASAPMAGGRWSSAGARSSSSAGASSRWPTGSSRAWAASPCSSRRLLPVVRTFIALPAGIARMPQVQFQLYTFLGSWPWCYRLAYIGARLGARWDSDPRAQGIHPPLRRRDRRLVLAAAAWFVWAHLRQRVRPRD